MPIYEYECVRCEAIFERRHGFHDQPLEQCPTCGAGVRRVYQAVGIIFKGPGFYITDSRPKPKEEGGTSDSATSPGKSEKSESPAGSSKSEVSASASKTEGAAAASKT